ncbi:DUF3500 domain-containing protein [Streptomyces sp. UP1A-1]|nr:DUF3500 domain-containing protein [Streptomyces sp. UP1A-1]
MAAAHSTPGAELARGAVEVERHRRATVGATGPDRYWMRLLGDPDGDGPWGWRLNGHHLAVHVLVTAAGIRVTPHFVGAEPALITDGPQAGRRAAGPGGGPGPGTGHRPGQPAGVRERSSPPLHRTTS